MKGPARDTGRHHAPERFRVWRALARLARYQAFVRTAMARETAYRLNVLITVIGFMTRVYILSFVWTHLYGASRDPAPGGIDLPAMLTYMAVAQLSALVIRADSTEQIRERLREGTIAVELMRPVFFPGRLLADALGVALFRGLLLVPASVFALWLIDIAPPPSPKHVVLFLVSIGLGFLVAFLINFLANLTAFWTLETFGLQFAIQFAALVLSGVLVPIWFLPRELAQVAHLSPFAAMFSTPLSIYIGRLEDAALGQALLFQVGWAAALLGLAAGAWRLAERHVVVQGG